MAIKNDYIPFDMDSDDEAFFDELERDDSEIEDVSEEEIVKKYDEGQARIIIQRNDFLIPNILQMVNDRDILNIQPSYQRRKRWTNKKKSHLIESLLINIPIPPVFLYEHDLAKYEVMDGQQRLDTVRAFVNNEFALTDLKKWPELNGRRFKDLPSRIQQGLHRRGLAAVIILTESGQSAPQELEIRQYVFERLNTGGQKLNAQEIRNCIYASRFNEMLVDLARYKLFTQAWGIPPKEPDEPQKVSRKLASNRYYATMADCEIVLRYFTLSDMTKFRGMKRTLDIFMSEMTEAPEHKCGELRREYLSNLQIATEAYGDALFRLPDKKGELKGKRSIPFSDAVLLGIREIGKGARGLPDKATLVRLKTAEMLKDKESYELMIGRGGNTKELIKKRIDSVANMFRSIVGE
jgi:hypothetical protein